MSAAVDKVMARPLLYDKFDSVYKVVIDHETGIIHPCDMCGVLSTHTEPHGSRFSRTRAQTLVG